MPAEVFNDNATHMTAFNGKNVDRYCSHPKRGFIASRRNTYQYVAKGL